MCNLGDNDMTDYNVTEKQQLLSDISDLHKDVYGFRPDGYNDCSMSELESILAVLIEDANEQAEHEELLEQEAIVEFEQRVSDLLQAGANDRQTAIRWLSDGIDSIGELEWMFGVPYGYIEKSVN